MTRNWMDAVETIPAHLAQLAFAVALMAVATLVLGGLSAPLRGAISFCVGMGIDYALRALASRRTR